MQSISAGTYFRRRAIVALIVFLLCVLVFILAMQVAGVRILADEAMRARVLYCIGSNTEMHTQAYLARFFTDELIATGEIQNLREIYKGISISDYAALVKVESVWVWPWGGSATVRVHDTVRQIKGDVIEAGLEEIPAWPSGSYKLKLVRRQPETAEAQ